MDANSIMGESKNKFIKKKVNGFEWTLSHKQKHKVESIWKPSKLFAFLSTLETNQSAGNACGDVAGARKITIFANHVRTWGPFNWVAHISGTFWALRLQLG